MSFYRINCSKIILFLTIINYIAILLDGSKNVHNHKRALDKLITILDSPDSLTPASFQMPPNNTLFIDGANATIIGLRNESKLSLPSDAPDATKREGASQATSRKYPYKYLLDESSDTLRTLESNEEKDQYCIIQRTIEKKPNEETVKIDLVWICLQMVFGLIVMMGHLFWLICCCLHLIRFCRCSDLQISQIIARSFLEIQLHLCSIGLLYSILWMGLYLTLMGLDKKNSNFRDHSMEACDWWSICGWSRKILESITTLYWLLLFGLLLFPSRCHHHLYMQNVNSRNFPKSRMRMLISFVHLIPWTLAVAMHLLLYMLNEVYQYQLANKLEEQSTVFLVAEPPNDCHHSLQWNAAGVTVHAFISISPMLAIFIRCLDAYRQRHKINLEIGNITHSNEEVTPPSFKQQSVMYRHNISWQTHLIISIVALLSTISGVCQFLMNIITYVYYDVSEMPIDGNYSTRAWIPLWLARMHSILDLSTMGMLPMILCRQFSSLFKSPNLVSNFHRGNRQEETTLLPAMDQLEHSSGKQSTNVITSIPTNDEPQIKLINLNSQLSNPVELLDLTEFSRFEFTNVNKDSVLKLAAPQLINTTYNGQGASLTLHNPLVQSTVATSSGDNDGMIQVDTVLNACNKELGSHFIIAKEEIGNEERVIHMNS